MGLNSRGEGSKLFVSLASQTLPFRSADSFQYLAHTAKRSVLRNGKGLACETSHLYGVTERTNLNWLFGVSCMVLILSSCVGGGSDSHQLRNIII